jgi:hypothetical protein
MLASNDLISSMKAQGFIYCADHNIFYRKELEDEAEEKRKRLREKGHYGLALLVRACPSCKADVVMPLLSLGQSRRSERLRIPGRIYK